MNHRLIALIVTVAAVAAVVVVVVFCFWNAFKTTVPHKTYNWAKLCETPASDNGESTTFWRTDAGAAFEACNKRLEQTKEVSPERASHLYCVPAYRCE